MRAVVQRVNSASVLSEGVLAGKIGKGFLVLVGVADGDTEKEALWLANKVAGLRVFDDENGKMNLNLAAVGGNVLAISNFTLYGDASHGFRPSFVRAMEPVGAEKLYDFFCLKVSEILDRKVEKGVFQTYMKVTLENDGPITLLLDTVDMGKKQ